jgi:hypothetical protein
MATAQVKKHGNNLLFNQSDTTQSWFVAFIQRTSSIKEQVQTAITVLIERVWASESFPILKTSQVVQSQNKQMHFLAGLVHQPSTFRNVLLTNNEHEVAFAVLSSSQKFSHHTYTSIHHNEPSISSIITQRS